MQSMMLIYDFFDLTILEFYSSYRFTILYFYYLQLFLVRRAYIHLFLLFWKCNVGSTVSMMADIRVYSYKIGTATVVTGYFTFIYDIPILYHLNKKFFVYFKIKYSTFIVWNSEFKSFDIHHLQYIWNCFI